MTFPFHEVLKIIRNVRIHCAGMNGFMPTVHNILVYKILVSFSFFERKQNLLM